MGRFLWLAGACGKISLTEGCGKISRAGFSEPGLWEEFCAWEALGEIPLSTLRLRKIDQGYW